MELLTILPFGIMGSTQLWNSDNPSSRNYGINTRSRVPKSPDLFWTEVQGWYNPTTFSMTEVHRIHSEPRFKDDTILPPSRWPKFTGSILNRSSRMIQSYHILNDQSYTGSILNRISRMIQSYRILDDWSYTGSVLNQISRMIQSYHILDDRGHWITSRHMSQDDTIPLHSRRPRSLNHFRESSQGWYNPTSFSKIEVFGSL